MDGIILVNKEANMTSRDVVDAVVKKFKTDKVGHTGTLDPFATGLMIITIGKGTKTGPFLEALEKTYVATIKLGSKTTTGDLTGEVVETKPIGAITERQVWEILKTFVGESTQIPPMYSALKVDGVPLYKMAREGKEIERKPRQIRIISIKLKAFSKEEITIEVRCSKGTYIRTLGEDIAAKLGTVGHLTMLERTSVGPYSLNNAHALKYVSEKDLISVRSALDFMEKVVVKGDDVKRIKDGKPFAFLQGTRLLVIDDHDEVLAVYEIDENGVYRSLRGLF